MGSKVGRQGLWAGQVGDWRGGAGLVGRLAGTGEWDWRSNRVCRRGKVPSGRSPLEGAGGEPGGRTLSTRPSGLSSVARAMVFTCSV